MLGLVLERAGGRPYQDLLAERLLTPLGMTCSGVGPAGGGTRLTGHALGRPARCWPLSPAGTSAGRGRGRPGARPDRSGRPAPDRRRRRCSTAASATSTPAGGPKARR
ncbi:MAG TPA: serine hydrolase [Trebonia sp.]